MMKQADEQAVRAANEAIVAAWNQHDMKAYSAFFADDASFVNVLGQQLSGRRAIEAQHENLHRTLFRNSTLRSLGLTVRFLADGIALCHMNWEMKGHERLADWKEVRSGIATEVMVRQGESWQIVAFHNTDSVPVPATIKP